MQSQFAVGDSRSAAESGRACEAARQTEARDRRRVHALRPRHPAHPGPSHGGGPARTPAGGNFGSTFPDSNPPRRDPNLDRNAGRDGGAFQSIGAAGPRDRINASQADMRSPMAAIKRLFGAFRSSRESSKKSESESRSSIEWVVAVLGNPDDEYARTRLNAGS